MVVFVHSDGKPRELNAVKTETSGTVPDEHRHIDGAKIVDFKSYKKCVCD